MRLSLAQALFVQHTIFMPNKQMIPATKESVTRHTISGFAFCTIIRDTSTHLSHPYCQRWSAIYTQPAQKVLRENVRVTRTNPITSRRTDAKDQMAAKT
jgi:hypothetical protein